MTDKHTGGEMADADHDLGPSGLRPHDTWPDPIIRLDHTSTWGTIRYVGEGFTLHWTDGVTGDWTEVYPRLDVAVMRLALLMYCGQSDWWVGFTTDPAEFYKHAGPFAELCMQLFAENAE